MLQQEITPDYIKHCLYTTTDYKNSRIIKQAVSEGQEQYFQIICEAIHEILVTKAYPPMSKLLALRLSKELIDLFNMKFVKIYEDNVLFALREFAIYQCPSTDPNRGNTFFGENQDKDVKQIGVSLVRLSLDCVKAWAMFFPQSDSGETRKYYSFYLDLISHKVNFPPWAYYKQDFVENHESPYFKSVDLMETQKLQNNKSNDLLNSNPIYLDQPIKVAAPSKAQELNPKSQIHQTPNATPADPKDKILIKAKQVLQLCVNLKEQTGDICSHTLTYQHGDFDHIRDESMAKHQEMDLLVNDLIDIDEEDLAAEAMIEMDNLKALSDDINQLISQPNHWQTFRKKYMGNRKDYALQQQLENETRERQRIAALEEQQRREQEQKKQQEEQLRKQKAEEEQRRQQQEREQQELQRLSKLQQEQAERERKEQEQQRERERERKAREQQEQQRREHERQEKERLEQERLLKERQDKDRQEKDRQEKERLEKERIENERRIHELKLQQEKYEKDKAMRELQFKEQQRIQEAEQQEKRIKEQEEYERQQRQNLINTDQQQIQVGYQLQSNVLQQQNFQDTDQHKIQQLIGGDSNQFPSSQFQKPEDSRMYNSQMGRSTIQNRLTKPVSHSSQGKRQQQVALKLTGDISGAPDVIVEIPQQKASQQDFYSSQVSVLTDQLKVLQNENQQLRKQLEEEEKISAQLKINLLQIQHQPQSNVLSTDVAQQLENLKNQCEKQMRDIHNLQNEKIDLEKKNKDLQKNIYDQKTNTETLKASLKDSHEQDLNARKKESQQLFQEKQVLLQKIDLMQKRLDGNLSQEQNIFQLQQQISQQSREIQELKKQKEQLINNSQKDIDLKMHELSEQQQYIDTLQKQIDLYKQQVEKGNKDYTLLQEKQKESIESAQQQIFEARKQELTTKSELNQAQLKLSDKEEEYKQLNLTYKQVVNEKNSLQKKYEQEQQQSSQILQMYQNGDSKNTTLLQSKLKQALDEMDKMRENHRIEMKDKDEHYQARINQLVEDKQALERDIKTLQYEAQQAALNAIKIQTPSQMHSQPIQIKLSSKPGSQHDKSAFSEQISVNAGNPKAQEVFTQPPEQNIYQPICPLPTFKHFPSTCLFNLPKLQEKGRMITAECLELIFPYQDPADYFQNRQKKNRKGKVIQSTSVSHEIAHLDTQNRNLFKQRCLGSQGLIYLDNDFQFGLSFQNQNYQGRPYYTYGLYIYNANQRQDGFFLQFLEIDQFSQFWASPIELRKPLYESSQELVEILVSTTKTPFQLLTVQVGHSAIHPYQFYIPNHICQSIVYKDIRLNEFRNKWASNIQNQMRTELLLLNKAVFGNVQQFLQLIPRLLIYNSHKINDYEMGIDEIKLVGMGNYYDLQFLIKFEILPDDKICIYLTFETKQNSKRYLLEQILQGYAFILGNGKSQ